MSTFDIVFGRKNKGPQRAMLQAPHAPNYKHSPEINIKIVCKTFGTL